MASPNDKAIVWVKWAGNRSKKYDGTVSGVPMSSLVDQSSNLDVGTVVEVWWGSGKSRKIWHGIVDDGPTCKK